MRIREAAAVHSELCLTRQYAGASRLQSIPEFPIELASAAEEADAAPITLATPARKITLHRMQSTIRPSFWKHTKKCGNEK